MINRPVSVSVLWARVPKGHSTFVFRGVRRHPLQWAGSWGEHRFSPPCLALSWRERERGREIFPNPCTMAPGFASLPLPLLPSSFLSLYLISTRCLRPFIDCPTLPSPIQPGIGNHTPRSDPKLILQSIASVSTISFVLRGFCIPIRVAS
ncbi:hypothetical protein COCNU_scaffold024108G000010 [Cocos nucifera]|nr:hypothetical protein [Cocos nucifera]